MRLSVRALSALIPALLCAACGGGGSVSTPAPPPPPVTVETPPDFSALGAELERLDVTDAVLIIGDATGELYRYEKGRLRADTQLNIASASKLLTGLGVWSLIDAGRIGEDARPQDVIEGWTDDPQDPRSQVTLAQLLSFTSGFNSRPRDDSCPGDTSLSLRACVAAIYRAGVETAPGAAFAYGPDHMQVAALMVREATGRELSAFVRENVWDAVGASAASTFPNAADNVRYSGGLRSTAQDYGRVLAAVMREEIVRLDTGFLDDRTGERPDAYTIPAVETTGRDWNYGFGFWLECDTVPFAADCAQEPTISSPGAFGFTPWIDFEAGYWGVIAMQEPLTRNPSPSVLSVDFQQVIQPMIAAELRD